MPPCYGGATLPLPKIALKHRLGPCINRGYSSSTTHTLKKAKRRGRVSFYLASTRIRSGVSEGRIREVPELSATSSSVLATLSGSVSEFALLRLYLYKQFTTWSKKLVFNFGSDILGKLFLFAISLWVRRPSLQRVL
jgi:hypothetical protein